MTQPSSTLSVFVTGAATELGRETARLLVARGHQVTGHVPSDGLAARVRADGGEPVVTDPADEQALANALRGTGADVVLHLAPQRANTLLHDGHKWAGYERTLPAEAAALTKACAAAGVALLVHGSYALLYGDAREANEEAPLVAPAGDPVFAAAIEAERIVHDGTVPTCILRFGYLYGPQFKDLALYVRSFRWHRAYLAGPRNARATFVHVADAAAALALVVEQQPAAGVFNVVDGAPVSFADFMDYFAVSMGFRRPLHIPRWGYGPARAFIARQHIELVQLVTTVRAGRITEQLGWQPAYPDYRSGLAETTKVMREEERTA